jgi:hypothetical protein
MGIAIIPGKIHEICHIKTTCLDHEEPTSPNTHERGPHGDDDSSYDRFQVQSTCRLINPLGKHIRWYINPHRCHVRARYHEENHVSESKEIVAIDSA